MKIAKLFKSRKLTIAVTAIIAIAGIYVGSTYAFFTSATQDEVNKFSVGSIDTELVEEIVDLTKKPSVNNVGKNDCLVRMRVNISPSDVGISLDLPANGWVKDGEFYYYTGIVEPGASTTPLFTEVTLPSDWYKEDGSIIESKFVPFDIGLYQEAVQATVYDANGNELSAYTVDAEGNKVYNADNAKTIWDAYVPDEQ